MLTNLFKSSDLSKLVKFLLPAMLISNVVFSQSSGFGSLPSDRTKPIEFNSDRLIFDQEKNWAELFDRVQIIQGKTVLSANYVKAIYSSTNKLEVVFAETNVELKSDQDIARGDTAVYSLTDSSISLTGNAQLVQGKNKIMADKILINTKTGLTQLLGGVKSVVSPSAD